LAGVWAPRIDADALATLGIDLEAVRGRLEETFGRGALEQTRAGMLEPTAGIGCVAPRLKVALVHSLDHAGEQPVQDEHVLLGLLSVRDSLAARALAELGVSFEAADAIVRDGGRD
jgi:ATP-dependent Clp protease ATP-binding subunit ClpA